MSWIPSRTVLLVIGLAVTAFPGSVCAVDDQRLFGGRLLIVIVAAGEQPNGEQRANPDGSYDGDPDETDAFSNFMQFRRQSDDGLPSYAIVITSDSQLEKRLRAIPQSVLDQSGFIGTTSASVEGMKDLLDPKSETSLLNVAIKKFENEPQCRALMRARTEREVLPFVKAEIVVTGENTGEIYEENGASSVPVWETKEEFGSLERWKKRREHSYFSRKFAAQLMGRLDKALVQLFITACHGSDFAELFRPSAPVATRGGLFSYIASTDSEELDLAGGNSIPPWAYCARDVKAGVREPSNSWNGADSATAMVGCLFERYKDLTIESDPLLFHTININPFKGFNYTSADQHADAILKKATAVSRMRKNEESLLRANFASEIPTERASNSSGASGANDAVKGLCQRRDVYRAKFAPIVNEKLRTPSFDGFERDAETFLHCLDKVDPSPVCAVIRRDFLSPAQADLAAESDSKHKASADSVSIYRSCASFFSALKEGPGFPNLGARYKSGDITLSVVLKALQRSWGTYSEFRTALKEVANNKYGGELPAEFKKAFHYMDDTFAGSFKTVQIELFPILRQETIKVRLAKLNAAIEILASDAEISGLDRKAEIQALSDELTCLTEIPVGPAFDVFYAKRLETRGILRTSAD